MVESPDLKRDSPVQQDALFAYTAQTLIKTLRKVEKLLQRHASPAQEPAWEDGAFIVPFKDEVDPLLWLRQCRETPRFYWSNRDGSMQVAACGIAYGVAHTPQNEGHMQALQDIFPVLGERTHAYTVLYFDANKPSSPLWKEFDHTCLFVPLLEAIYKHGQWKLYCNVFFGKDNLQLLNRTRQALRILLPMTQPIKMVEPSICVPWELCHQIPQMPGWKCHVKQALNRIAGRHMHKVVLARQHVLRSSNDVVDPLQVFLRTRQHAPSNCFSFFWQPSQQQAFMGFSPERLYTRRNSRLYTEAVAGTRPLGEDASQNALWRQELLASTKDGHEQQQVTDFLQRALGQLCSEHCTGERTVLQAGHVQHLVTPLEGDLHSHVTDADILSCLHPTPAVCGNPRDKAQEFIAAQEGFDRGCYGGVIGYVGKKEAEFAVAIRSALLVKNQLHVFAGAGIVEGSDPLSEWEETQSKMGVFAHLLD